MTENTNASGMKAEARSTYTPPSYAIAPEDRAVADSILAMDPLRDVASPVSFPNELKLSGLKITALPPELRQSVADELQALPFDKRAGREPELVAKAIQSVRGITRQLTGNGPDALPYHSEMLTIANEYRDAQREADRIFDELGEVSHHDTVFNDATGKQEAVPIFAVQGVRRTAMETRLMELHYKCGLLMDKDGNHGIEAQRRLDKSLLESVAIVKRQKEDAEIHAEAKLQAAANERKRRIDERADQIARFSRNEVL